MRTWRTGERQKAYSRAETALANRHVVERKLEYGWALDEGKDRITAAKAAYKEIRNRYPDEFATIYQELLRERGIT